MTQIQEYLMRKGDSKDKLEQSTKADFSDYRQWKEYLDMDFPDDKKPRANKDGKEYLWWKAYKMLCNDGPMSRPAILSKLKLKPTSYSAEFAKLSAMNIIVAAENKKNLVPMPPTEWKTKKQAVMTRARYGGPAMTWEYGHEDE